MLLVCSPQPGRHYRPGAPPPPQFQGRSRVSLVALRELAKRQEGLDLAAQRQSQEHFWGLEEAVQRLLASRSWC